MRALPSLLLAGAVGLGGLLAMPATAEAGDHGWRGRGHYYRHGPAPGYYRPPAYYAPPPVYYRPPPPVYYRPPPVYYRPPPPAYYAPPPAYYAPPPAFYGAPRSYGIPPGPGVGLFIR